MTEPGWWEPQAHLSAALLGIDSNPWGNHRLFEPSSIWEQSTAEPWLNQAWLGSSATSKEDHRKEARFAHDPITGKATTSITFTRFDGTNGHVFAMRPDGSHVQQLTDAEGVQAHSTWAPNGRFLVFTQVDTDGASVQLQRTGSKQPQTLSGDLSWSMVPHVAPNSRRIAFTSNNDGNYEIYSVARNGSGLRQLTFSKAPVQQVGPKYSPNGKLLLFASDRDEADPANQQNLWTMASGGGPMRRLTQGLNNRESRSWSPDGSQIVSQTVLDGVGQIVVMDADGGNQRQITRIPSSTPVFSPGSIFPDMRGAVTPAWSPNGRWIAFASNHQGTYDLYRIRPDGTGLRRILKSPDDELSVGWGPRR